MAPAERWLFCVEKHDLNLADHCGKSCIARMLRYETNYCTIKVNYNKHSDKENLDNRVSV
jgi:hypothetical protein